MQQRQLRLGDILDDYCPRERRLTNHVIVAMIGEDVKQTRCTTCDADHEYKHAKIPRQRRKGDLPALAAPAAIAPKKVVHEAAPPAADIAAEDQLRAALGISDRPEADESLASSEDGVLSAEESEGGIEEGPVHRQLIRAQLPKHEGQTPIQRQGPDFTIRQPTGGRPGGRFRPRNQNPRGGSGLSFQGNRGSGGAFSGNQRGAGPRHPGGPPRQGGRPQQQQGRKRSK